MSQEAPTKICTSCGQRKPLSAFLQMNKAGTASHGQICASCRKTLAENAKRLQGEDTGTQETGHKIDTKARMKAELDKRQLQTDVHEDYHENRDLDAVDAKSSEQKQEIKQQTEKKIRTSLFGKQSFLNEKKHAPVTAENTPAQIAAEAQTQVQTELSNAKEERQKTQHDPSALQLDAPIAGQARFQSVEFQKKRQEFLRRLGKDSPFMRHVDQAKKTAEKNKPNETLEEHIEKTWGPSKPKR